MNADQLQTLNDHYVAQVNWLICRGREDLIDVIADEYERDLNRLRRPDASSDSSSDTSSDSSSDTSSDTSSDAAA